MLYDSIMVGSQGFVKPLVILPVMYKRILQSRSLMDVDGVGFERGDSKNFSCESPQLLIGRCTEKNSDAVRREIEFLSSL